jgi:phosphatidate phosphatase
VGIFGTAGPIVFIILVEFLNASILPCQSRKSSCRKFAVCLFHGISLFALGISLTLCLTEIGKRWVGRLRPHFISVCNPNLNVLNCSTSSVSGVYYNPIYTGGSFCQNTDLTAIREARFSFPSGHSSYSWYSMVFLIIYLEARLVLLRFRYLKTLIQMGAFIAAFVTCLSRISDYHHRGSDVIGGAVLGMNFSNIFFKILK